MSRAVRLGSLRTTLCFKPQKLSQICARRCIGTRRAMKSITLNDKEAALRRFLLDAAAYANRDTVLRFAGGWVRDKLLGGESHDIDVAINNMTGEQFGLKMNEFLNLKGNAEKYAYSEPISEDAVSNGQAKSRKVVPSLHKIEANPEKSKNLETVTTKFMGIDLDFVNLRKETYDAISRNPQMEFGTAEEDASRRDATVNALLYNLHTDEVEDFTSQGFEDLANKIIRTPLAPYQTFKDDPLRVLRLIRFSSRLDFTIEPETAKAMGNTDIQEALKIKISRERVGIELEKMLKGPRPHMALSLISDFGLYETIFTAPTRNMQSCPNTSTFKAACDLVQSITHSSTSPIPRNIPETLIRNPEEEYLAWVTAALMPWADAPTIAHEKKNRSAYYPASLAAQEGFKAPNKVRDVITASLDHYESVRTLVAQCSQGLKEPSKMESNRDPTARNTLGMAIRRWGPTWRTQVLFALIREIVLDQAQVDQILSSYSVFLDRLVELDVLEAWAEKPCVKGQDLANILNQKPGVWMKKALEDVIDLQLQKPGTTEAEALEWAKRNIKP